MAGPWSYVASLGGREGDDRFHMNTNTSAAPLMFCYVLLPCLFNTHSLPERNEGVNECLMKLIKNQQGWELTSSNFKVQKSGI